MPKAKETKGTKPLFYDVNFTLIKGPNFNGNHYDTIRELLLDHGGVEVEVIHEDVFSMATICVPDCTHVISPDIEFTEYSELERQKISGMIEDRMITVVRPEWVTDSVKKGKTQHLRSYNADPRMIFSGIDAVIADLPEGDKETICGGIIALGGVYKTSLSKLTTHIVALNLDNEPCKIALEKGLNVKIIVPHWFDDCLKLGHKISESEYLLPNPSIFTKKATDPVPYPDVSHLAHAHEHKDKTTEVPSGWKRESSIFANQRFWFGRDLGFSTDDDDGSQVANRRELKESLTSLIKEGGGSMARNYHNADVLICHWREGIEYVYASRKGMIVGNLTWLYWMISRDEWCHPTKMLLHYPRSKAPIPGMQNCLISVSNYGGDARMYLENLIEAAGGTFTRAMKPENTHLITARDTSDKVQAAREWNTNMVNHLWLEETYAKWEIQTLTNQKYTQFPKRTNLMEVVGRTRIDLEAISRTFFPDKPDSSEIIMKEASQGEIDLLRKTLEEKRRKKAEKLAEEAETPRANKRAATLTHETPRSAIVTSTPASAMSTGGRRAKENATKKLHDNMADVLQFEKEMKRKGGVLHGGKKSHTPEADVPKGPKKRLAVDPEDDPMDEDERPDTAKKGKKKKKQGKDHVPVSIYLLLTAYDPWVDHPNVEEAEKNQLREIGIQCIENPDAHMTHLSAPSIVRTAKFVCALARAPIIINSNWVRDCLKQKSIIDTTPYLLKDPAGEKKLKISLPDSLARAKENNSKMLDGLHVYITPNVSGGWETFKKIVDANGGSGYLFKAVKRGGIVENKDASTTKKLVLLSLPGAKDEKLWAGFNKMAKESGWEPLIYKTEWLLDIAMSQKLVWSEKFSLSK